MMNRHQSIGSAKWCAAHHDVTWTPGPRATARPPSSSDQSSKKVCLQVTSRKMSTRLYCSLKSWMEDICLPLTLPRKVFLRRFDALLTLRGFSSIDCRSVQSAMEVLLRFRKDPRKQTRYPPPCLILPASYSPFIALLQVPREYRQENEQVYRRNYGPRNGCGHGRTFLP
jgi:hypothetical protein